MNLSSKMVTTKLAIRIADKKMYEMKKIAYAPPSSAVTGLAIAAVHESNVMIWHIDINARKKLPKWVTPSGSGSAGSAACTSWNSSTPIIPQMPITSNNSTKAFATPGRDASTPTTMTCRLFTRFTRRKTRNARNRRNTLTPGSPSFPATFKNVDSTDMATITKSKMFHKLFQNSKGKKPYMFASSSTKNIALNATSRALKTLSANVPFRGSTCACAAFTMKFNKMITAIRISTLLLE
mmetsp:Transcript_71635/g.191096  ORF Transcript_71635/g.191096 Transcript_71635/m.191096 type:complete len:238 (+) Transcript_71635:1320-2033(+)